MKAFAKALLLIARYYRRQTIAVEAIQRLYEQDLRSRGVLMPDPRVRDKVEIMYGAQEMTPDEEWHQFEDSV